MREQKELAKKREGREASNGRDLSLMNPYRHEKHNKVKKLQMQIIPRGLREEAHGRREGREHRQEQDP